MKKKVKFIISVVPLTKIPLYRDQFFYYSYSKVLSKGTLVKIPLGKRGIEGIVLESKNDFPRLGNIELKNISEIIEEKFLTPKQISLIKFISDYYIVSLGIVMKSFVPKRVKARGSQLKTQDSKYKSNEINLTKEQQLAIKEITKLSKIYKPKASRFLLFGPSSSGKTQIYFKSIKKIISRGGQALILLPELTITSQEIERYGDFFGDNNITVLHSRISKGKFYDHWKNIKSGKARIIIGTRQAVFAPFKNLKIIVIDEEQDMSHKQWDMNPRYDARRVAEELAEKFNAKLILGSATPLVKTFYESQRSDYKLLTLSELSTKSVKAELVDLKKEHWINFKKIKNVSPISKRLEGEISWMLKNGFQTILFINRQGMSKFTICDNCGKVLKCPDCERSLTYKSKGNYECIHCKFETGDFPTCPKCQGMVFKNIGLGTEKIESEIEKMFPDASIARADSSSIRKSVKAQEKLWKDFSSKKIDILVGTQMIAKAWDLNNVGLVGIIDADSLFSFPDYMTEENAFSLISQVIGRTGRIGAKLPGKSIIQTYHPENQILQWAAEKDYKSFYDYEIRQRKTLLYPPFSKIIKLTFQSDSKEKLHKETDMVFKKLSSENGSKSIKIFPPQNPLSNKIRGRYRKQIIIKILNNKDLPKKLKNVLYRLESGWIIDVDPISLI